MTEPTRPPPALDPTLPIAYAQEWLKIQAQMLATMQTMTERWFEHRRRGVDALWTTVAQISACKDPTEFAAAQRQWLADSSDRLAAEIAAVRADAMALTQTAAAMLGPLDDAPPRPKSDRVA
jgi:hypothetical protein